MTTPVSDNCLIKIGEDLECPLCLELFKKPRSLHCLHTFCQECLQRYLEKKTSKTQSLTCPVCRESTPVAEGDTRNLKQNLVVSRLVDTWRLALVAGKQENKGQEKEQGPSLAEGAICLAHADEFLTQYCCICKVPICRDCIIGDHRNHTFEELSVAVKKMKQDVSWALAVAGSCVPKLQSARDKIIEMESKSGPLLAAALALEKEINLETESALSFVTDAIKRERDRHLAVVRVLQAISSGDLLNKMTQSVVSTLDVASAVIDSQDKRLSATEVAHIYPELRRKLGIMVDSCVDGGLLDNIGELTPPTFRLNQEILQQVNLGRLDYPLAWRLIRTFTLPSNRTGEFQCMLALPGGKLAIGYKNGGIDVFDPCNTGEHKVLLPDVKIRYFAVTKRGSIAVVTSQNKLHLYSPSGEKKDVVFNTPPTSGLMSVAVDEESNLLVGLSERKSVYVYSREGGNPLQIISLQDFDVWQVCATKMGRIIAKNLNSIRVFDRSGKVCATITESPPLCTFATADSFGRIYTLVLRKDRKVSVARHAFDGTLEQTVTKEQEVYKINDEKYWFGLAALSGNSLAMSDSRSVFIYSNAPLLPDLLKLAK